MRALIYGFSGKKLGGIETFALNMNEHMSDDCVFDYIIEGDKCAYTDRILANGGKVLFVPWIRKHPFSYFSGFRTVLKNQREQGTSVFYVQLFSMAKILPILFAKSCGYSVILHAHNNGLQSKGVAYTLLHNFGKLVSKKMNFVRFTNSKLSSDFMFGKNVEVELIYNAIDTDKFSFSEEVRTHVRKEFGYSEATPVFGFVGRLEYQKNPQFLIDIFSEILKISPDAQLIVIGDGELKDEVKAKAAAFGIMTSIKWLGIRDDVVRLMQGMDVLLQPSRFEGLGITLIEAQSCCLPCISSEKVIPDEARVTDLLRLVSLDSNASVWADAAVNSVRKVSDRAEYIGQVAKTNFNINVEAKRLEQLLLQCN